MIERHREESSLEANDYLQNKSEGPQDRLFSDFPQVFVYLDDNLVATATVSEHLEVLRRVFSELESNGLVLNVDKCSFLQPEIDFLGHRWSAGGVAPLAGLVDAIEAVTAPTTPKELQRFLGMVNFYRRFLPTAACTLQPLTEALKGNPKILV